jgi:hypothetical protein
VNAAEVVVHVVERNRKRVIFDLRRAAKTGTRITVRWPDSACSNHDDAEDRFLQIAVDFTWINPHLNLSVGWKG